MRIAWLAVIATSAATTAAAGPYPAAPRAPVVDNYGDLRVTDDYRWLEDARDPRVISWVDAENRLTRQTLDAIPDRAKIHARITQLLSDPAPHYRDAFVVDKAVFVLEHRPPAQQAMLAVFRDPADPKSARILVDPNALDPSGGTTIDFYVPSRDGKRVAISLSKGGSESGDLHIYDVATGKPLPDIIPRVNGGTAGGSIAWNASATGFWYTRYPHDGERPAADLDFFQQVYFHKLGTTPASDAYVFGKDLPRIAEISLLASPDGQTILISVANGDGGEHAFYTIDARGVARKLFAFADQAVLGKFGPDNTLYFLSHKAAPHGAILRLARPYATAPSVLVGEGEAVIDSFAATASYLYVTELVGGPSRLRRFHLASGKATAPEVIATPLAVPAIYAPRLYATDDLLYASESYTAAPAWYHYSARTGRSEPTALATPTPFAMDDIEVIRDTCTSADGTRVPITILRKRGIHLDGSHPAMLTGYGGYAISITPRLQPLTRLWLDQGGVFAEANLRGGGELGEAWHRAGMTTQKQHVFDDFYACGKTLIAAGYTSSAHLAIEGWSNGGLLMGATLTQHPELARVVISHVGIYDVLREELTPNGEFNITEIGTIKDPAQLHALYAYSPYHHVVDHTAYPSILLTTGANDPRVDPYNARKMTARLQTATASGHPILLRASSDVGHGIGSPLAAEIDEATDVYSFLMSELGMQFMP